MKKSAIVLACLLWFTLSINAQQARSDIKANVNLAASNYLAYPGPQKKLSPAPAGYEPFYISHYGRHGSRYTIGKDSYNIPYFTLLKADSLGKLTPRGKEVLFIIKQLRDMGLSREGELTLLGAQQHRDIARRMYERFPQVFNGNTHIDAKSTVVIRCILSMENALQQLLVYNPKLDIRHDASRHDMYYMNDEHNAYDKLRHDKLSKDSLKAFNARHSNSDHLMSVLFNDSEFVKSIDRGRFVSELFKQAKNLQSTDLRNKYSLWNIFSDDEIYNFWQMDNAGSPIRAQRCAMLTKATSCHWFVCLTLTALAIPLTTWTTWHIRVGTDTKYSRWPAMYSLFSIKTSVLLRANKCRTPTFLSKCCSMKTRQPSPLKPIVLPITIGRTCVPTCNSAWLRHRLYSRREIACKAGSVVAS